VARKESTAVFELGKASSFYQAEKRGKSFLPGERKGGTLASPVVRGWGKGKTETCPSVLAQGKKKNQRGPIREGKTPRGREDAIACRREGRKIL